MQGRNIAQSATPLPDTQIQAAVRVQHQFYVPNFKAKSKSRAGSLLMEFLNRVFCHEGASRFFKTFLHRFLRDGAAGQSGEDCSGRLHFATP